MNIDEIRLRIDDIRHKRIGLTASELDFFCTQIIESATNDSAAVKERAWAYNQLITLRGKQGRTARALRLYRQYLDDCALPATPEFDQQYLAGLELTNMGPTPLRRRDRFYSLIQLFQRTLHLEGLMAECGCSRGLSSYLLCSAARMAQATFAGRGYRIFDSFAGLSVPQPEDEVHGADPESERLRQMTAPGKFAATLDTVKTTLAAFPDIEYFPGWIPHAFPDEPDVQYRFVHVDVDLYQPTLDSLGYFYPKLIAGGIIVSDDYNWPGAKKAIEEFCAQNGVQFTATSFGQAYLVRSG